MKCFKKGILWFIFYLALFRSHSSAYAPVHGYICVAICAFGIVTNLVHVLVLSRPNMRCSAVNCVLTAVAICDMGTMASYLIYICHFVLIKNPWLVIIHKITELWELVCNETKNVLLLRQINKIFCNPFTKIMEGF